MELVIGLAFIALGGAAFTWWLSSGNPKPAPGRPAPPEPPTQVIPRGTVHRAVSQGVPVSGVEPELARAESWPLRQRH